MSYRSIVQLQRANGACRRCADAGFAIESAPVVEGRAGQRAYLYGQAPGAVEGDEGRPWRGRAGRTLRRWLELDEEAFYETFYCVSVTRCYPGKAPSGRGDRTPVKHEQAALCDVALGGGLRLLTPQLIVTIGGLAARRLIGVTELTRAVGHRFELGGAAAIPLPHPSGASGWLNDESNRTRLARGLALMRAESLLL